MAHLRKEQVAGMNIHYVYYSLDYFLDAQQKAGFKTIELLGAAPHFLIDYAGFQDTGEVRKKVEDRGMKIGVFTPECAAYHFLLCSPDPEFHKRSMEYFKQGIKAASKFGAKYMLTNCIGGTWDEDPKVTYERAVKSLKELGPVAADYNVTLAIETVRPEESKVVTTLPELDCLHKEVNHPNVKIALDTIAMGVSGETPQQWFETFGSDIVHCHFVDGRPYGHLIWGDGLFPMERYIKVLNDYHYEGYLGQEITDGRYFDNPAEADRRNFKAFEPYFVD
jgi:fructoselysine 3-epimerase